MTGRAENQPPIVNYMGQKEYMGSNNVGMIQWAVWASLLVLAEPALLRYPPATEHNAASTADCCLLSIHLKPKHSHF